MSRRVVTVASQKPPEPETDPAEFGETADDALRVALACFRQVRTMKGGERLQPDPDTVARVRSYMSRRRRPR